MIKVINEAEAKEQLSKMSQEEKDNIVMNYLMNK